MAAAGRRGRAWRIGPCRAEVSERRVAPAPVTHPAPAVRGAQVTVGKARSVADQATRPALATPAVWGFRWSWRKARSVAVHSTPCPRHARGVAAQVTIEKSGPQRTKPRTRPSPHARRGDSGDRRGARSVADQARTRPSPRPQRGDSGDRRKGPVRSGPNHLAASHPNPTTPPPRQRREGSGRHRKPGPQRTNPPPRHHTRTPPRPRRDGSGHRREGPVRGGPGRARHARQVAQFGQHDRQVSRRQRQ